MELSKRQREVIDLMRSGWRLQAICNTDGTIRAVLTENYGLERKVSMRTVISMLSRSLLYPQEVKYPTITYELVEEHFQLWKNGGSR